MNLDLDPPPVALIDLADKLKALAEPKRLLILHLLMEGVQCNCELGGYLDMAPNLISHHLRILREAGLVDVERDAVDARWVYYSVNRQTLDELHGAFGAFFAPDRIKPRRPTCGPSGATVRMEDISFRMDGVPSAAGSNAPGGGSDHRSPSGPVPLHAAARTRNTTHKNQRRRKPT